MKMLVSNNNITPAFSKSGQTVENNASKYNKECSFEANTSKISNPIKAKPSSTHYFANYALQSPLATNKLNNISFQGYTANKITKVISITDNGEVQVLKRPDGGYLVDKFTNTVLYYGKQAINYLENTRLFDKETEVISQSGCAFSVATPKTGAANNKFLLDEPGAILIQPGTHAKVDILNGNPLVIVTEKKPDWHEKTGPDGMHKEHFDQLVGLSEHYFKNDVHKSLFSKDTLEQLVNANIVTNNSPLL